MFSSPQGFWAFRSLALFSSQRTSSSLGAPCAKRLGTQMTDDEACSRERQRAIVAVSDDAGAALMTACYRATAVRSREDDSNAAVESVGLSFVLSRGLPVIDLPWRYRADRYGMYC
jgi:hypothetical protein